MKIRQVLFAASILLSSCSSPKYVYNFDHFDYNSGRKTLSTEEHAEVSPVEIRQEMLTASADKSLIVQEPRLEEKKKSTEKGKAFASYYQSMSKSERQEFKTELKKELKAFVKKEKSSQKGINSEKATKAFDTMVSLAIVFGAAGIVLTMLAGISNVFWVLGAISIIIGAFFFVKWVADGNG